jgi:hypothetical protein
MLAIMTTLCGVFNNPDTFEIRSMRDGFSGCGVSAGFVLETSGNAVGCRQLVG